MSIYSAQFWKGLSERVIASAAGGALAAIGNDAAGVLEMDLVGVASIAGGAALVSLLKGLVTHATNGTASVGGVERPRSGQP